MMTDAQLAFARQQMNKLFPSREHHLLWQLEHYAETLQHFDATFYDREPILDVTLNKGFARNFLAAFIYAKGIQHVRSVLERIVFSDGTITRFDKIWTLNYMPSAGISIDALNNANIAEVEVKAGYNGETLREMLRNTYRCGSAAEEDYFVRRWIAS